MKENSPTDTRLCRNCELKRKGKCWFQVQARKIANEKVSAEAKQDDKVLLEQAISKMNRINDLVKDAENRHSCPNTGDTPYFYGNHLL
jgi:NMD protein affecting ribosome stability and mRNA decay